MGASVHSCLELDFSGNATFILLLILLGKDFRSIYIFILLKNYFSIFLKVFTRDGC